MKPSFLPCFHPPLFKSSDISWSGVFKRCVQGQEVTRRPGVVELLLWKCVYPNLLAELIIDFPTLSSAQTTETPKTIMWTLRRTAAESGARRARRSIGKQYSDGSDKSQCLTAAFRDGTETDPYQQILTRRFLSNAGGQLCECKRWQQPIPFRGAWRSSFVWKVCDETAKLATYHHRHGAEVSGLLCVEERKTPFQEWCDTDPAAWCCPQPQ